MAVNGRCFWPDNALARNSPLTQAGTRGSYRCQPAAVPALAVSMIPADVATA